MGRVALGASVARGWLCGEVVAALMTGGERKAGVELEFGQFMREMPHAEIRQPPVVHRPRFRAKNGLCSLAEKIREAIGNAVSSVYGKSNPQSKVGAGKKFRPVRFPSSPVFYTLKTICNVTCNCAQ
ncbi:hypothetical protein [Burkholderia sp. BCC0419]|uniref:hypothetical protein n=1 Tax=Burkholderia sp. BCC0419 TaxID=486878 RepID=UPI001589F52D|nr:hypothetical protein [Burkholderia sp. BCC0419]